MQTPNEEVTGILPSFLEYLLFLFQYHVTEDSCVYNQSLFDAGPWTSINFPPLHILLCHGQSPHIPHGSLYCPLYMFWHR